MTKRTLSFFALLLLVFSNFSCNKDKKLEITYPVSGTYGTNLLAFTGDSVLTSPVTYSFHADLGTKATLKVVVTKIETPGTTPNAVWFFDSEDGWNIGEFNGTSQQFEATKTGAIDLNMVFMNTGTCRIDFYENSSSVTKSKVISW
ncbi:MAG: hypothetical protein RLZZ585_1623 [Bacteroidota bacterium]|jgi:hypothetical protein